MKEILKFTNWKILMLSISIFLTSCYVYKPVTVEESGGLFKTTIKSGNYIRLVLNNGEKIEALEVVKIDSTKLEGLRVYIRSDGTTFTRPKTILTMDIKSVKLRKKTWFGDFSGGSGLWGVW